MEYTIFAGVCILFIILGLVDLIKLITFTFLKSDRYSGSTIVIPIKGHDEHAEFILRSAAAKIKWTGSDEDSRLICLDCGMDDETKQICNLICIDYDFMDIYEADALKPEIL